MPRRLSVVVLLLVIATGMPARAQVNVIDGAAFSPGVGYVDLMGNPVGGYLGLSGDSTAKLHRSGDCAAVFAPDSRRFVTAKGRMAAFWDDGLGGVVQVFPADGTVRVINFSRDGNYVAIAGGNTVKLWAVPSGRFLATLPHEGTVYSMTFSPNSAYLATLTGGT